MTRVGLRVVAMVTLWLLAWGELSVGNVLSGLAVAIALLVAFPARRRAAGAGISVVGVARLVSYVVVQLVPTNVLVAREVLARRSRVRTGVLAYRMQHSSEEVLSLVANVIALTPGTMTVEATLDPPIVYVHFLLLEDVEGARRSIARLERLAVGALGRDPSRPGAP